jgi:hypothetical protein
MDKVCFSWEATTFQSSQSESQKILIEKGALKHTTMPSAPKHSHTMTPSLIRSDQNTMATEHNRHDRR